MTSVSSTVEKSRPKISWDWTRVLFEVIDDAVFVHDLAGNILEANPAACRRVGYTRLPLKNPKEKS
jgi:PAS domain S-box-containing protein